MASVNLLRAVLVGGAVVAAIAAAVVQQWAVTALFTAGIIGHALLWVYLHREAATRGDAPR